MMRGRLISAALVIACALWPAASWGQAPDQLPLLDSRGFDRDFDGCRVSTTIGLRAGGDFAVGARAYLQIDIDSALDDAFSTMPRAVVINGFVIVALPPGLEPAALPRLMYYDRERGRYEFMYSMAYPRLARFAALKPAMDDATSNDSERILRGLSEITAALDPAVRISGPADPRLIGRDPGYAVTGGSWLLPCNVLFQELVGLFDPESGLESTARLRVSLPVKVTGPLGSPRAALFIGGLSAAVNEALLLPEEIPPNAIPLVPLQTITATEADDTPGAPPPEGEATDVEVTTEQAETEPAEQPEPAPAPGPARPVRRTHGRGNAAGSDGQDEMPDIVGPPPAEAAEVEAAAEEAPPPPPTPVPVLVYSYEWIVWETELDLLPVLRPAPAAEPPVPRPEPELPPVLTPQADEEPAGDVVPVAPTVHREPPTPPAREPAPQTEPEPTYEPEPQPERPVPAAEPEIAAEERPSVPAPVVEQEPGVQQVEPGTLPEAEQVYIVPLKPITGSGAGVETGRPVRDQAPVPAGGLPPTISPGTSGAAMTAGAYVPPADLGEMVLIPEGYFLMGTGSESSAGDADEMPQTQVYLPAYYIDKYPVTNRQFHNFVISAGYKPRGNWDKYYIQGTADLPVRGVSWDDALAYARWAGKRLPTEAEWEKAARGTDGRTYPWGEDWSSEILPRNDNLYEIMTAQGTASPYGVMGTVGLIWQWTATAYHAYPFNPDARDDKRVLRGGAYSNGRNIVRCANRYAEPANVALNTFGFRCVKDAP